MRKSIKEMANQKSVANLLTADFYNNLEKESHLKELELARELGYNVGEACVERKKLRR